MQEAKVIEGLAALAQSQRLRAFRALVVAGPEGIVPSVLSAKLDIAPNALSFHLKTLLHAKLVTAESSGRNLIYRANFKTMNSVLGYLTEHCCQDAACEVDPVAACRTC
ncbi:MAG TPA: helix-turn-helix transcriptional regulator [Ramlibacter sp.]|nr:helix-turn-helix transcriptional regulator [Ramlibacter sp.]